MSITTPSAGAAPAPEDLPSEGPAAYKGTGEESGSAGETAPGILSPQDAAIVRSLLNGGYPAEIISENHLMPQVVADRINEALFDDVGDSVIECEDDRLSLVEDYIDDITLLIGEAE